MSCCDWANACLMSSSAYKYVLTNPCQTNWHDCVHTQKGERKDLANRTWNLCRFTLVISAVWILIRLVRNEKTEALKGGKFFFKKSLCLKKQSCGYSLTHFWPWRESQAHCSIKLPLQWTARSQLERGTHGENDRMWYSTLSLCAWAEDYCTPMPLRHIIRVYEMQNAQTETPRRYWLHRTVDELPLGIQTRTKKKKSQHSRCVC